MQAKKVATGKASKLSELISQDRFLRREFTRQQRALMGAYEEAVTVSDENAYLAAWTEIGEKCSDAAAVVLAEIQRMERGIDAIYDAACAALYAECERRELAPAKARSANAYKAAIETERRRREKGLNPEKAKAQTYSEKHPNTSATQIKTRLGLRASERSIRLWIAEVRAAKPAKC